MPTERVQNLIETVESAARIAGAPPLPAEDRLGLEKILSFALPLWDEVMPLLVSDVVKAVKKEMQNG